MTHRLDRDHLRTITWAMTLGVVFLWTCSRELPPPGSTGAPQSTRRGGTLIVGASTDLGGVNQLLSEAEVFTQSVLDLLFLHLFEEQPDFDRHPPTFTSELADSWEWSEDHKVLTLRLRRGVVWSDGHPVTAEDVQWTWLGQIHPEVAWGLADSKDNIERVEAIDDHTLKVVFRQRNESQLANLNEGVILPKHAWSRLPFEEWRQNSTWFLENLVSNGPFLLESWQRQAQIELRRNESYFDVGRPYLDRVVFRIVPQKSNQVRQLFAGDLHFVDHIPPAEAARTEAEDGLRLIAYWPRQYNFICWNTLRPLFADAELRQALTMAIDRQALIDALWFGHARTATSPIISSTWAHHRDLEPWPYDPQASRRILQQRGWADTDGDGVLDKNGMAFSFELATNSNSAVRVDALVLIQEQLRRAGIEARLRRMEFNTLIGKGLAHDFDAMLLGWTIDTTLDVGYAFHSDAIDDGYNFGSFSDSEVDRLIGESRRQTDPAAKGDILKRIQLILHQQQPYTFLWEPRRLTGVSFAVQDVQPNALDAFYRLEQWWMAAGN